MILSAMWIILVGGHAEVVRSLLAFGAEPRWKNKQGLNAFAGNCYEYSAEVQLFETNSTSTSVPAQLRSVRIARKAADWPR
jgi:hypothetical protein